MSYSKDPGAVGVWRVVAWEKGGPQCPLEPGYCPQLYGGATLWERNISITLWIQKFILNSTASRPELHRSQRIEPAVLIQPIHQHLARQPLGHHATGVILGLVNKVWWFRWSYLCGSRPLRTNRRGLCWCKVPGSKPPSSTHLKTGHWPQAPVDCSHQNWENK